MCCLMQFYSIHLCLLDSIKASYFFPSEVCDQNRDTMNGISASKAVVLSIINAHYLLHFLGTMLFICVVTIPFKNIVNIVSDTLDE